MLTRSVGDPRRFERSIRQLAVVILAIGGLIVVTVPATAGLIFTSVQFDASVRDSGGDGPVAGVEQHFTGVDFPPPTSNHPLPATNPPLPPQLDPSKNLRMQFDFSNSAPLNGDTFRRGTIWITSATGALFANDLDDNLATPIVFETFVYLEELAANEKLSLEGVRIESFHLPPFPSATITDISTNAGSAADPIRVTLRLAQSQFGLETLLKVHFYYDTLERAEIPEPATGILLLGSVLGVVALRRRSD